MTNPSPPLFPLPQQIETRPVIPIFVSSSAAFRPAFSIRTSPSMPYSSIARRSTSRTCVRVRGLHPSGSCGWCVMVILDFPSGWLSIFAETSEILNRNDNLSVRIVDSDCRHSCLPGVGPSNRDDSVTLRFLPRNTPNTLTKEFPKSGDVVVRRSGESAISLVHIR